MYTLNEARINLNIVKSNFLEIKKHVKDAKICCVIKADAYGHGAKRMAKFYEELGADYFAVANINEAIELREEKITLPILILGYTPIDLAYLLAKYDICQSIYSYEYGMRLADKLKENNLKIKIHLKIDTGMGRIGFVFNKANLNYKELDKALEVCKRSEFITEGIFTHFALADEGMDGKEYTKAQFDSFMEAISYLEKNGLKFKIRHCCNSAGVLDFTEYHLDMVRAGIILFGLNPSEKVKDDLNLKPVMTFLSQISNIKEMVPGEKISYGCTYTVDKKIKVATVSVGYADGYVRGYCDPRNFVLVNNKKAKILGRICMDQMMIDVTDIDNVQIGDEVILFGQKPAMTAYDLAKINHTIAYEVICELSRRINRTYIKE